MRWLWLVRAVATGRRFRGSFGRLSRRGAYRAGARRAVHERRDATRRALRFHDLRPTGTTWMALRGDEPLKIMSRAGHDDLETTMKYIRAAEVLGAGADIASPFRPCPRRSS